MNQPYRGGYTAIRAPLIQNTIEMERAELERFCNEKHIPLFSIKVEHTVMMGIVEPCKPYMKYFTIYEQQWFVAREKVDDGTKQEKQISIDTILDVLNRREGDTLTKHTITGIIEELQWGN